MVIKINTSGTLSAGGPGSQIDCLDEAGEPIKLRIQVIAPQNVSGSNCYLRRYKDDGSADLFDLPNVQSIEETDSVNITSISTVIYGFDDNFAMDLGTTQRLTVTLKRVQPKNAIDTVMISEEEVLDTDYANSGNWSNGHWYEMLLRFIDGWQNLNYGVIWNGVSNEFAQTGGFRFHYEPLLETYRSDSGPAGIYAHLYPVIDENVFIAGQIGMEYSGNNLQTLTVSIPMAVSTMVRNLNGQQLREVVYDSGTGASFDVLYPAGMSFIASYMPQKWESIARGRELMYWTDNLGNNWAPGQFTSEANGTITQMTAQWSQIWKAYYDAGQGANTYPDTYGGKSAYVLTSEDFTNTDYVKYTLIGHGGDGGVGASSSGPSPSVNGYGGGGGSGGMRTGIISNNSLMHGKIVRIITDVGDSTKLTIMYEDGVEYPISIDNGHPGTNAYYTGYLLLGGELIPGSGGAGGTNGFPGEDSTVSAGGAGGNLSSRLNYVIYTQQSGNINLSNFNTRGKGGTGRKEGGIVHPSDAEAGMTMIMLI